MSKKLIRVKNKNVVKEIERRCKQNASLLAFELRRKGSEAPASVEERRYRLTGLGCFVDAETVTAACFPDGGRRFFTLQEIGTMLHAAKLFENLAMANHECLGLRDEIQQLVSGAHEDMLDEFEAGCR